MKDEFYFRLGPAPDFKPEPCSLLEWADAFESNRAIRQDRLSEANVLISTIFLGIDANWFFIEETEEPLLFETMIFGGPHDGYQERCSTYAQALEMHDKAKALALAPNIISFYQRKGA